MITVLTRINPNLLLHDNYHCNRTLLINPNASITANQRTHRPWVVILMTLSSLISTPPRQHSGCTVRPTNCINSQLVNTACHYNWCVCDSKRRPPGISFIRWTFSVTIPVNGRISRRGEKITVRTLFRNIVQSRYTHNYRLCSDAMSPSRNLFI